MKRAATAAGTDAQIMETSVFAGGCFWCPDAVYRTLRGVQDVVVAFDPVVISDDIILDVCFTLHDPRQLNQQGADVGTPYRPAMFSTDVLQSSFEAAVEHAPEYWNGGLVNPLELLGDWYRAESYHQDFFAGKPRQGLYLAVALPQVDKVRTSQVTYLHAS